MHTNLAALTAKIQARKEFLEKVVPFVRMLLSHRGKRRELRDRGHSTHVLWELKDFGGFSFECQEGVYSLGNGGVLIVRAPNGHTFGRALVHVAWKSAEFTVEDCKVESMVNDNAWQEKLLVLMDTWKEVAAKIDSRLTEAEKRRAAEEEKKRKEAGLRDEAKRLGIS